MKQSYNNKIVHIIPSLNKGGAERFVVDLCNELSKDSNLSITLISLKNNDDASFRNELLPSIQYLQLNKKPGFDLKCLTALTKQLKTLQPDIIHTHTAGFEYSLLYNLTANNKAAFYHTIHSLVEVNNSTLYRKRLRSFFFKQKIKPITISKEGQQLYRAAFKNENDLLIYNGTPVRKKSSAFDSLQKTFSNSKGLNFVHIGRVMKVKNQELLIQAFIQFNAQHNNIHRLNIVGDVRDEDLCLHLKTIIKDNKQIQFLGGKTNVIDYLMLSDAFCLTSYNEGMPISLIEAFSVGCIPISTAVGGIKSMIQDGNTGFLSNSLEIEDYVQTLNRFLSTKDKEKIAQNGKNEFLKKYNIAETAILYKKAYFSNIQKI